MGRGRPQKAQTEGILDAVKRLVKDAGSTTAPMLARELGVCPKTARGYLDGLVALRVVRPEGRCRHRRWVWCAEEVRF